jgi:hypothetical protein
MSKRAKFANGIIIGGIVLFLLLLIYLVYIQSINAGDDSNIIFYVVLIVGIAAFAFALTWQIDTKVNFVLSLLSFGMGIYLIEIYFTLNVQSKIINLEYLARRAEEVGAPFDTRSKLQVLEDLRSEGIDAYPTIIPGLFAEIGGLVLEGEKLFPLSSISNKTCLYCNENGPWIIYKSDEHGYRNPPGSYDKDKIDIITFGDSYTQGACVFGDEEIAGRLRNVGFRVLNLAHSGSSLQIQLATLKEYAEPVGIEGKVVLLFYFEGNDLEELTAHRNSPILMNYLKDADFSQGLINRQEEIDRALAKYLDREIEKEKSKRVKKDDYWYEKPFVKVLKLSYLRWRLGLNFFASVVPFPAAQPAQSSTPPPFDLLREALSLMRDRVASLGGDFHFVYLPHWSQYGQSSPERGARYRDQVLTIVEDLDVSIIDVHEAFMEHPDPLSLFPFRVEGHYNAAGYKVVVDKVLGHIK